MKILAISGLMLAAAAAVVSAAPAKEETGERVSYSGKHKQTSAPPAGDWVELASPTPAAHGREYITVDGRYGLLKIDAAKGRPILKTVRIVYADGKQKTIRVDRILGGKRATEIVSLTGEKIDHVVITTEPKPKASYTVHGAPVSSGVAAR